MFAMDGFTVINMNSVVIDSLSMIERNTFDTVALERLPTLQRFDPWRSLKVARQSAKRRAEGRWDNCGDPNRKAAAIAHNQGITEASLMTALDVISDAHTPGWRGSLARWQKRQMDADAKEAARLARNERERMRRAAKRQQTMEAA